MYSCSASRLMHSGRSTKTGGNRGGEPGSRRSLGDGRQKEEWTVEGSEKKASDDRVSKAR
jgi:hypothetical protein